MSFLLQYMSIVGHFKIFKFSANCSAKTLGVYIIAMVKLQLKKRIKLFVSSYLTILIILDKDTEPHSTTILEKI